MDARTREAPVKGTRACPTSAVRASGEGATDHPLARARLVITANGAGDVLKATPVVAPGVAATPGAGRGEKAGTSRREAVEDRRGPTRGRVFYTASPDPYG